MIDLPLWLGLMLAVLLALFIGWWWGQRPLAAQQQSLAGLQERYLAKQEQLALLQNQFGTELQKSEQQQSMLIKLTARLKDAEATLRSERIAAAEKLQLQQEAEDRLTQQFENLANRIFEQSSGNFRELNQHSLDVLLGPLREQLEGFRRQVGESYAQESSQRHHLQFELQRLAKLNEQMSAEAAALTRALKGDSKQQGNWGEVVLARILSDSGLREGHEYQLQVNIEADKGKRYQPDVIVHLPNEKDIIIDAKVSLTAYERWYNADDEASKALALKEHIASLRNHIRELGRKDYQQLPSVRTLDYVLMFVAVEPAFLTALSADPSLVRYALDNNILLVSPTNLMVALRTIENLWRYERQNQNARQIAERAGRLYEKLRLFVVEMQQMGTSLHKAQESYDKAMGRLVEGKGNLIAQAERFRELGVEVSKTIPASLIERAHEQTSTPSSAPQALTQPHSAE